MRLIDADAFNEYLESGEYCKNCRNIDTPSCCDCPIIQAGLLTFMRMIDEQPTTEERKTGKWIFGSTLGHSWMKCSECCKSQDGQTLCFTYCPNCGAKMEGVEYE